MSLPLHNYAEKRDFIRMTVDAPVTLKSGNLKEPLQGLCKNLSGTGMLVEIDEALTPGLELAAHIPSPNANFPPLDARVRVVRCTACDAQRYLLGVEILEVAE